MSGVKGLSRNNSKYNRFKTEKDVSNWLKMFRGHAPFTQIISIAIIAGDIEADNEWTRVKVSHMMDKEYPNWREEYKNKKISEQWLVNMYLTEFLKEKLNEKRANGRKLKIRALELAIRYSKRGTGPSKRKRYRKLIKANLFSYLLTT
jgi:hypothetical protein